MRARYDYLKILEVLFRVLVLNGLYLVLVLVASFHPMNNNGSVNAAAFGV